MVYRLFKYLKHVSEIHRVYYLQNIFIMRLRSSCYYSIFILPDLFHLRQFVFPFLLSDFQCIFKKNITTNRQNCSVIATCQIEECTYWGLLSNELMVAIKSERTGWKKNIWKLHMIILGLNFPLFSKKNKHGICSNIYR